MIMLIIIHFQGRRCVTFGSDSTEILLMQPDSYLPLAKSTCDRSLDSAGSQIFFFSQESDVKRIKMNCVKVALCLA